MTIHVDHSLIENFSQCSTATQMTDVLFEFMQRKGSSFYDEAVTQLEHALQAALLARQTRLLHPRWPPRCFMTSAIF